MDLKFSFCRFTESYGVVGALRKLGEYENLKWFPFWQKRSTVYVSRYRVTSNNSRPLIILAPLNFQKKVSSTSYNSRPLIIPPSNNSRIGNWTKLYWYRRQVIFVFFRPTVKITHKELFGTISNERKSKKLIKNRSGNTTIIQMNW